MKDVDIDQNATLAAQATRTAKEQAVVDAFAAAKAAEETGTPEEKVAANKALVEAQAALKA